MLLYSRHEQENVAVPLTLKYRRCRSKGRIGMGEPSPAQWSIIDQKLIAICLDRFAKCDETE